MSNLCSLCKKEGVLIEDNESIFHKGEYIDVSSLYFYECTSCGEHFIDSSLDKTNSEQIQKAKEAFDEKTIKGKQNINDTRKLESRC